MPHAVLLNQGIPFGFGLWDNKCAIEVLYTCLEGRGRAAVSPETDVCEVVWEQEGGRVR